jgi:GntR family transcriptional regulator/MocR family aminotransferase
MLIPLKLVRDQQLQQQIFDQLRDLIVSNRLRPGSRMPSSRMMAEQFAISRMTVLLTYERLIAEGYLETRPAAGTFVAHPPARSSSVPSPDSSALSLAHPPPTPQPHAPADGAAPAMPRNRVGPAVAEPEPRMGGSDPSLFPAQRWRSLMRAGLDRMGMQHGAEDPAGSPALREAIAGWLSTSRGLAVSPDQVMMVKGRQQALHVVAHLAAHPCEGRRAMARSTGPALVSHGCPQGADEADPRNGRLGGGHEGATGSDQTRVVVEDPCDAHAAAALACEGGLLVRVPVDADGLCTDRLPETDAVLIHVTPEHQRPLGAVLSRDRRTALLHWAAQAGALILEEDIDGELRYGNMNVPSLMSLDRSERVILIGGFGVSLGPWLDTAYMVLPRWLVPFALATRRIIDDSRSGLEQMALAEFLGGGGYARHLHRLSKAYANRRDALLAALQRNFEGPPLVWGEHAGLHLSWFPPAETGAPSNLAALARVCGLEAAALPADLPERLPGPQAVLLGFGSLPERQIEARVGRFAGLVKAGMHADPRVGLRAGTPDAARSAG